MTGRLGGVVHPKAADDHQERLEALQHRLARLQTVYHRQGASAIILLEGWDAAGKGGLIKRLTADLDPRHVKVVPVSAPTGPERAQHYLTRFWHHMPPAGTWAVFDRSWYGRVLVERVEGYASAAEWRRAYAEINAMEAMHLAHGTRIIKLFLHTSQTEQDRRLIDRLEAPWKRWKVSAEDFRNRARRADYLAAMEDMFAATDRPGARWHIIGADHKKHARIEGLGIIADALEAGMDMTDPPLDPALQAMAERELGATIAPRAG